MFWMTYNIPSTHVYFKWEIFPVYADLLLHVQFNYRNHNFSWVWPNESIHITKCIQGRKKMSTILQESRWIECLIPKVHFPRNFPPRRFYESAKLTLGPIHENLTMKWWLMLNPRNIFHSKYTHYTCTCMVKKSCWHDWGWNEDELNDYISRFVPEKDGCSLLIISTKLLS